MSPSATQDGHNQKSDINLQHIIILSMCSKVTLLIFAVLVVWCMTQLMIKRHPRYIQQLVEFLVVVHRPGIVLRYFAVQCNQQMSHSVPLRTSVGVVQHVCVYLVYDGFGRIPATSINSTGTDANPRADTCVSTKRRHTLMYTRSLIASSKHELRSFGLQDLLCISVCVTMFVHVEFSA